MKMLEIFRFDLAHQGRRPSTWLYFGALLLLTWRLAVEGSIGNAREGGYLFNGPYVIALSMLIGSLMSLLVTAALAGDAGARDVQSRMHPLLYTAPVSRVAYLGGRFLSALVLNALVLLAIPIALLIAATLPGPEAALLGPFRPAAYLGSYLFIGLANAFVLTSLLFALSALTRRAMASYVGGVLVFALTMTSWLYVARRLGKWTLAKLLDPLGFTVMAEMSRARTPAEKSTLLIGLEGSLLHNRLLWMGIALGVLLLAHARFRFAHPVAAAWRVRRRKPAPEMVTDAAMDAAAARATPIRAPRVRRTFGAPTRVRQVLTVAMESFRSVVTSWGGLVMVALLVLLVANGPELMEHLGVPLRPTAGHISGYLGMPGDLLWMIAVILTAFYAGEMVWRERDAGISDIADAAPVPEWAAFAGRFLGLSLVMAALQALLMVSAMLVQARAGHYRFEPGVYARILLGAHLVDYLLFALLALTVHVLVNQKYVGHLVVLVVFSVKAFADELGIEHNLLVYASDPGMSFSDMRGFGPALAPWLWFKLYWAAWGLLLAVAARLFWPRGREGGRLRTARGRFGRPAALSAGAALVLIVGLGGFVFYNTNVLHEYRTEADALVGRAEYERRYGQWDERPQPQLSGTHLHVEIHPRRREMEIRGSLRLVNRTAAPIDTIHLSLSSDVETGALRFDRPARRVLADAEHGVEMYALGAPLQPGDSLRLAFRVRFAPRGFANDGTDLSVAANGTYVGPGEWLPEIGYLRGRELSVPGERRAQGLPPRRRVRALEDVAARHDSRGVERIAFDAVIGTDADQVAVAPGRLRRTWTEGGRRYFHYATDAPIRNDFAFYSARYAVHEGRWRDVSIQVFHHPGHAWNAERMVRGVRASLDYYAEQFGPYPHRQIRLVEHPGRSVSLHSSPVNMSFYEGFSLMNPEADRRDLDFPFAVVAHEVAHQWWGDQLTPAHVEGAGVLSESLAWYSALSVVRRTHGDEHLGRLLGLMREMYLDPRARADVPLIRATDRFHAYRKGPFAMYAVREYVGEAPVNGALRRLLREHPSNAPPLPTALDLYDGLRAATPDSLHYLLHDLFAANTFWELETNAATAQRIGGGWRVTLDVTARKVVVDTAGVETEKPMNDLVEIGVYAASDAPGLGAPLYQRMHRVRSGPQLITIDVPREPTRAGIDPRHLLIDVQTADNVAAITRGASPLR